MRLANDALMGAGELGRRLFEIAYPFQFAWNVVQVCRPFYVHHFLVD